VRLVIFGHDGMHEVEHRSRCGYAQEAEQRAPAHDLEPALPHVPVDGDDHWDSLLFPEHVYHLVGISSPRMGSGDGGAELHA
jgi:hypothetical protein